MFGVDNKTHTMVGTKYGKEPERLSQLKMQITRDTEPRSSFKDIHELNLPEEECSCLRFHLLQPDFLYHGRDISTGEVARVLLP